MTAQLKHIGLTKFIVKKKKKPVKNESFAINMPKFSIYLSINKRVGYLIKKNV